jgi:hypothetical protein
MRLVHSWVKDDGQHEAFLPALPYAGHRPPCPMLEEHDEDLVLEGPLPVQCLGLGVEPVQMHPLRDRLIRAGAIPGSGGAVLGAVGIGHPHPDALLIRLFQPDLPLAGTFHPELVPYQIRLRDDVLAAGSPDSYRAAWALLEDLQREGWLMPLPTQG